ncbi:6,7-dimethyl-8-ribityllumazine synthase [Corynebacterium amycolatum]|uniref:6,7-dimethyl-8-ribityllumazine synthase n=1 Tax=Corynebacterium amycolatum TaxID=43765 RepID=UPI003EDFED7B
MSGAGLPEISVPDSTGVTVGLVTSHWNEEITGRLRREALAQAEEVGAVVTDVTVVGALEIPVVVQQLARTHDAVVALGCVIRGGTPHFDYVCDSVTEGLTRIALDCETPVGNGVLTCNTEQQAIDRAGGEGAAENKGREAMAAALHTVAVLKSLRERGAE